MRRYLRIPPRTRLVLGSAIALAGCGSLPSPQEMPASVAVQPAPVREAPAISEKAQDVVLFALGLVETGYRFGGKNPEAGLDCSGMVSYVFGKAIGLHVAGSAADIARLGRPVEPTALRPGDLVFFNTLHRPYSHVGIYVGDGRFVHAPSTNGRVRTDSLTTGWFAPRFEGARTYFD